MLKGMLSTFGENYKDIGVSVLWVQRGTTSKFPQCPLQTLLSVQGKDGAEARNYVSNIARKWGWREWRWEEARLHPQALQGDIHIWRPHWVGREGGLKSVHILQTNSTGPSKRRGAKFGEGSSVRADWLCFGCLKLEVRTKAKILTRDISFARAC